MENLILGTLRSIAVTIHCQRTTINDRYVGVMRLRSCDVMHTFFVDTFFVDSVDSDANDLVRRLELRQHGVVG